jgi:hypothetical protein
VDEQRRVEAHPMEPLLSHAAGGFQDAIDAAQTRITWFVRGRQVSHHRASRWVRANCLSHDSHGLRYQRGSKIAVENRDPLRKLRDEKVKRVWEKSVGKSRKACFRGGVGS